MGAKKGRTSAKKGLTAREKVLKKKPISITKAERLQLYAARRFTPSSIQEKLGIKIKIPVYFQDPLFAKENENEKLDFDEEFFIPWEPGIASGPTSARFAVVDYNGDAETLVPAAEWNTDLNAFVVPDAGDKVLDKSNRDSLQFHQVNVWSVAQNALDFFESGFALGRRIPWAFEGNRLIIVPHAGYGENAYYDRDSKSLQFYYFDRGEDRIFTCLSADIINHEFGHAVLDGVRPYYIEAILPETAAFHEFLGDLTAILISFRNNEFRQFVARKSLGDLSAENALAGLAKEFGRAVNRRNYLRSALNDRKMADVRDNQHPHFMSEVLTGAMFDIIIKLSRYYQEKQLTGNKKHSILQAFWFTIQRMQSMAIQPLDLLPPVDATFKDYALAVLRAEEIANPTDPDGYQRLMQEAFRARGILEENDIAELREPRHVFDRLVLDVYHDIDVLAGSRAEAYRFLDDNRDRLLIPASADLVVADLYSAQKLTREGRRLPKQIVLQYVWREDLVLHGPEFGTYNGKPTSLLCGGTLALDQDGNIMAWRRKPGTKFKGRGQRTGDEASEAAEGEKRLRALLHALAQRIKASRIGSIPGGEKGLLPGHIPPLTSRMVDGALRFELTPHFGIHDDKDDDLGSRQWEISS
jgi:hypothetical protein